MTLGIIGGSGLYQMESIEIITSHYNDTPFGFPSAPIIEGNINGSPPILFLPRHGVSHQFLPHEVNYRANIFALKELGASRILSISAIGSLRKYIKPGDLVLIDQYIDLTKGLRAHTFFGEGVIAHTPMAHPICPALSADIAALEPSAHQGATYACIEGPRFSTKAESKRLRAMNADVVGMTNTPEAFLAREAQLAYASMGIVTDYDCWDDAPGKGSNPEEMMSVYIKNVARVKDMITKLANTKLSPTPEWITKVLKTAIIMPHDDLPEDKRAWLKILQS